MSAACQPAKSAHCKLSCVVCMAGKTFWPPRLVVAQLLHAALANATPLQLAAVRNSALRMWLEMALSAQLQVVAHVHRPGVAHDVTIYMDRGTAHDAIVA